MLIERMLRAARLEGSLYAEVENDPAATQQAVYVVVLVGVLAAVGSLFDPQAPTPSFGGFVTQILTLLLNWVAWCYLTYFIGTRLFRGTATPEELIRTLGLAITPGVLNVLGFIPCVGTLIRLVAFCWVLVAGVVAVREALDVELQRALGTVAVGWVVMFVLFLFELILFEAFNLSFRML